MAIKDWKKTIVDKRDLATPELVSKAIAYQKKENLGYLPYDLLLLKNKKTKKYRIEIEDGNIQKHFETKSQA